MASDATLQDASSGSRMPTTGPTEEAPTVDRVWLTDALQRAGVAQGAVITRLESQECGTGQVGRVARLTPTWDKPEGRPTAFIGKFPSADPGTRAAIFGAAVYLKEWIFYEKIASSLAVRAPECFVASYDADTPDFVLVLEDLGRCQVGDQIAGLSSGQVALALEQAAHFHAPHYGDASIQALLPPGQPLSWSEEAGAGMDAFYRMNVGPFIERLGDRLDADVVDLLERVSPLVADWTRGQGGARTLVHSDFRADNFMFGVGADAPPIVVLDWQTWTVGDAATDVAYLVGGSFSDAGERAAVERDLVGEYADRMAAAGIDRPSGEWWESFRFGSLWGVIMTVNASMVAARTPRGDTMLATMANRHARQVIELEALTLLDRR